MRSHHIFSTTPTTSLLRLAPLRRELSSQHKLASGDFVKLFGENSKLTGIIQYRIWKNEGSWANDYILEIETEFENYDYNFLDGESDLYWLETNITGTHSFKYNSGSPAIKQVTGTRQLPPPAD
jgi:hypothetical protein